MGSRSILISSSYRESIGRAWRLKMKSVLTFVDAALICEAESLSFKRYSYRKEFMVSHCGQYASLFHLTSSLYST